MSSDSNLSPREIHSGQTFRSRRRNPSTQDQPGESLGLDKSLPSSPSSPSSSSEDIVIEKEVITETIYSTKPEGSPTILTEERTMFSHITPFLSKQRLQWWLPIALALSFALILLVLRTTMVDTPQLSSEQGRLMGNSRHPFEQQEHHLAHTARRGELSKPGSLDEIVHQMEDDVKDIKNSLSKALHKEHAKARLSSLGDDIRSTMNHMHDRAQSKQKQIEEDAAAKFQETMEKGKHAADYVKDKYEGGKMYVRDKLHHIPEDLHSLYSDEAHLGDKLHHLREEVDSLLSRHFAPTPPSLYERIVNWFGGSRGSQFRNSPSSPVEPHPSLEPHYLDALHYSREGQLRQEMEHKLREAKELLQEEHKKTQNVGWWSSIKNIFHHPEDVVPSEISSLTVSNDSFNVLSPKLRELLSQHDSPHAKSMLKELEDLEKKGQTYESESKGHFSRIRHSANSIIHQALSTLESAKQSLISTKDESVDKIASHAGTQSNALQRSSTAAPEHLAMLEESIRHVYALAREQAEHQAKLMSEYGRHSASSTSEWLRHEKEKARIQAFAHDKEMSDRHHDAPGLLFDPLAV